MPCRREGYLSEVIQFQYKLVELVNQLSQRQLATLVQLFHQTLVFFCDLLHEKSEISQHQLFLNFYARDFNQFENIASQNKDTEVVSLRKNFLIKLLVSTLQLKPSKISEFNFGFQQEIKMARMLFFCMVLRKFSEITKK